MEIQFDGKEGLDKSSNRKQLDDELYYIIRLPNFTVQNASTMTAYINLTLKLNSLYLFNTYNLCISNIHASILNKLKLEEAILIEWQKNITKLREDIEIKFDHLLPSFEGGLKSMTMFSEFIEEFRQQLLELKPIKIIEEKKGVEREGFVGVENLISEIKDEVKKGNRVSFKLMQELQSTIEELSSHSTVKEKEFIENSIKGYEEKAESFLKIAIQAIDSMDLIYQAALKTNLKEWAQQIESVIQDFLHILEGFGIEEMKANGMFFEGESMISIGTVSPDIAPHLEKYQVFSVHERGFRFKESGKLIREAKVTTIY